ncbi:26S protease regulatory subunit 7 [Apostichopus japonicus]|uniref:26S proteasome regulatory subunit 7 n=1 Tax=Stichopus japonicus TaxID=307972 RepID=A0A2G8KN48_STIJA|nr:26S protease regulatory subunit 7 [Apostichopus japonicus]
MLDIFDQCLVISSSLALDEGILHFSSPIIVVTSSIYKGAGPYSSSIKEAETDIQNVFKRVNELTGIKESDTGLANPALWDLQADKQALTQEQPLQVARCTKILNADTDDAKYIINVKQFAKFVVDLHDTVAPTDIEEGMRVGVDRNKYQIHIPLPPKIDPTVTMMQVEEKPDVTYSDIGGCKEQIEKLREVVETPLLHPERFVSLGIEPPKGVLLYGPPGTGKTLCARAVANRTDACFIRVIGSELVQKYVGEGARMVRELFEMARRARFDDGAGGDNEVQRTMLELINQLDGFDPRGNIKVLMATNRPDTLDPALVRPGRLDRKVEFGLPDLEGRSHIFKIHARSMSVERDIRYELLARLCPNCTAVLRASGYVPEVKTGLCAMSRPFFSNYSLLPVRGRRVVHEWSSWRFETIQTNDIFFAHLSHECLLFHGQELKCPCTEAGMFAIRARRKIATEKDFREAINKVIKAYAKFSSTPRYMTYN